MSSAFVKEGENEQLKDVAPNMASLIQHLTREYRAPVKELHSHIHPKHHKEVHEMSDGLGYMLNDEQQWQVILE